MTAMAQKIEYWTNMTHNAVNRFPYRDRWKNIGTIHHYTSAECFFKITHSDDLLLFDCRLSNDAAEISHGISIVSQVLDQRKKRAETFNEKNTINAIEELENRITTPRFDAFISCFSGYTVKNDAAPKGTKEIEIQDRLSQWRGYGADGRGMCISFDQDWFLREAQINCGLCPVFYDEADQEIIVNSIISDWYAMLPTHNSKTAAEVAAKALSFFIPLFKNSAFAEEEEWRLIFTPNQEDYKKMLFLDRGDMKIPYFKFKDVLSHLSGIPLPITEVMLGPSKDQKSLYESVWHWIKQNRPDCKVSKSSIPYRGRS